MVFPAVSAVAGAGVPAAAAPANAVTRASAARALARGNARILILLRIDSRERELCVTKKHRSTEHKLYGWRPKG